LELKEARSTGFQHALQWGQSGDVPVLGDYDGDGRTDVALWRPGTGEWFVLDSSTGFQHIQQWGQFGDIPVPGDYDGDGKTDFAVWRPATAEWFVIDSSTGRQHVDQWGQRGDLPVPDDYDGDRRNDFAVWRPSTAEWFVIDSSTGRQHAQQWGQQGDVPLSNGLPPQPPQKGQFIVTVVPSTIFINQPTTITISAVDAATQQPVPGAKFIISNFTAPRPPRSGGDPITVNEPGENPFTATITFHYGRELDGETGITMYDLAPDISASAPNYIDGSAALNFN